MNRKERRRMEKSAGEESTEKLAEKIFQFNKLPESCSACDKGFDKRNKDMVQSWSVVIKQEVVRLFCPECQEKAKKVLENVNSSKNR